MTLRTDPIDQHVAGRLRELREESELSRADLARAIGAKASHIRDYEAARVPISASTLFEMAAVLGVTIDEFFKSTEAQKQADVAAERESTSIVIEYQVYRSGKQLAEGGVTLDGTIASEALGLSVKTAAKKAKPQGR